MLLPTLLLLATSFVECTKFDKRNIKRTVSTPTPFQAASPLTVTSHVLELSRTKSANETNPRSASYLTGLATRRTTKKRQTAPYPVGNSTVLISLFDGEEFATNITFGTQTFSSIVDTGSSDTWIVETGFQCVDVDTGDPEDEDYCAFGPTYTIDDTFVEVPDVNFNITYGDGEFLSGIFGTEEITLAGVTVNQTVPVVNFAAWDGDGVTSGLIGLAYPNITSEYAGDDPTADGTTAAPQIVYNPIFTTMYEEGLVSPIFSLVIERNLSGPAGYLTLGGVPDIDFVQNYTSTPILVTTIEYYPQAYDFYAINVDAFVLDGADLDAEGVEYIVDSGTTLIYLPTTLADTINTDFVPPAVYYEDYGFYIVDCDAVPPSLGITIGNQTIPINPLDLILGAGTDETGAEVCISGIDDGGADLAEDVYVLGDVFFKNVVAVFDVGVVELFFASREFYPSDDPYKI